MIRNHSATIAAPAPRHALHVLSPGDVVVALRSFRGGDYRIVERSRSDGADLRRVRDLEWSRDAQSWHTDEVHRAETSRPLPRTIVAWGTGHGTRINQD
jgi:hypothetical protein